MKLKTWLIKYDLQHRVFNGFYQRESSEFPILFNLLSVQYNWTFFSLNGLVKTSKILQQEAIKEKSLKQN